MITALSWAVSYGTPFVAISTVTYRQLVVLKEAEKTLEPSEMDSVIVNSIILSCS